MIYYDKVLTADGRQIFGGVYSEVAEWCHAQDHRYDKSLTVFHSKSGEMRSVEDYLYGVPDRKEQRD